MKPDEKDIALILRQLNGELNSQENVAFLNRVKKDPEFEKIYSEYSKTVNLIDNNSENEIKNIDVNKEWNLFKKKTQQKKAKSVKLRVLSYSVAASIAIIFGLFYLFSINKEYTLEAENQIIEKALQDGSKITLSSNSIISYKKNSRLVKLKGKAFFEVTKDKKGKNFIVKTDNYSVKVLGTKFVVSDIGDNIQVIVKEGLVEVSDTQKKNKVRVKKGESVTVDKDTQKFIIENIKSKNYLSWKTKEFIFEETTLREVFELLEQAYGYKIVIKDDKILNQTLTSTFKNEKFDVIISVLKINNTLKIRTEGKIIYVSSAL